MQALDTGFGCIKLLLGSNLTKQEMIGERHEFLVFADRILEFAINKPSLNEEYVT